MTGQVLWEPTPESVAASRIGRYATWLDESRGRDFADYQELWQWSVDDLDGFWQSIWHHFDILADGDPTVVLASRSMPGARWFPDVRLNYAENMLRGSDHDVVVTALSQTRGEIRLTRAALRDAVARVGAALRRLGVGRGDRVVAYLPNIPETLIAMLATTSIGATWAVCAPELGTQSVLDRLTQLEPKVLLAVDGYRYGDKDIDRRPEVDRIRGALPSLAVTVAVPYLFPEDAPADLLRWEELLAEPARPKFERVPFDHPLWVLFSSGTTGLPKAITHSHGGMTLEYAKALALQCDLGPHDRFFVYTTTTWMMWNFQVSGLLTGAMIVLFDGNPAYPDAAGLWRVVEDTGVTVFGCGAAFLVGCRKAGMRPGDHFDLSRLRGMVSTGSPLPAEAFQWVYGAVNPTVLLQSSSGGTDVATAFVGGNPMLPVHAGEIATRMLGVNAQAFDEDGSPVVGQPGEFVVTEPMPSMPVFFWNDPDGKKYRQAYFDRYPGVWCHGDWATFSASGACVITGRSDGTLNRGGIRLGTSEFYSVLGEVVGVADSLVVHIDDPSGGPGTLILFVEPASPTAEVDEELRSRIVSALRERLSPRHVPDEVIAVPAIPYNLTGKKLEIPVKRLLQGHPRPAVVSEGAVRNPESLEAFSRLAEKRE
ncbi:acetoacetate--CoA ligase [Streptomyces sp. NPDC001617]